MKSETLLPETLGEWSKEAVVPHDLADRALRGRARYRFRSGVLAAGLTVAVVLVAVAVPQLVRNDRAPVPAAMTDPSDDIQISVAPAEPAETDLRTDTGNSPPRTLIAAGRTAVSAYYIDSAEKPAKGPKGAVRYRSTWYLYNPSTESYEKTPWAALDVAPGLKYAAVLEDELPTRRVGILDTATREVVKWIGLDHPVGEVAWSPDGTRLLTTAYDEDPRMRIERPSGPVSFEDVQNGRTGFHVVDVNAGTARFHAMANPSLMERTGILCPMGGSPFGWSHDGALIWESTCTTPSKVFYDLQGRPHDPPNGWTHPWMSSEDAGISPDGRLYADGGAPPGPQTTVREVGTGKLAGVQTTLQLLAWADDEHLIGLGCAGRCENEFHNGLVLVSLDGKQITQLSGDRENADAAGTWRPLLTRR
ncbi:hypothetical protein ABZT47_12825 [Sphaerisporangium sp. NPDC005289]|uniref:hypothetical protein n=1 Tax=Sphaerisporangium sp. NPDC005289 TaxID=3155247 RepID=UPI0033A1C963